MIQRVLVTLTIVAIFSFMPTSCRAERTSFHVLAIYSKNVEIDHLLFAEQAVRFFAAMAAKDGFEFASSTDWNDLNATNLAKYQVILWLNDSPQTPQQRDAFQQYMTHGGGWLGFHAAAYNDADTKWPWFVDFLGGAVFYGNSWPPLPAKLRVDDKTEPIVQRLPSTYQSPANEWYIWRPDPRDNADVKVLLTVDASSFPLGLKDVLVDGDLPVVWRNRRYRMIYMNMGHGDRIFTDAVQNRMIENSIRWLRHHRPEKTAAK